MKKIIKGAVSKGIRTYQKNSPQSSNSKSDLAYEKPIEIFVVALVILLLILIILMFN